MSTDRTKRTLFVIVVALIVIVSLAACRGLGLEDLPSQKSINGMDQNAVTLGVIDAKSRELGEYWGGAIEGELLAFDPNSLKTEKDGKFDVTSVKGTFKNLMLYGHAAIEIPTTQAVEGLCRISGSTKECTDVRGYSGEGVLKSFTMFSRKMMTMQLQSCAIAKSFCFEGSNLNPIKFIDDVNQMQLWAELRGKIHLATDQGRTWYVKLPQKLNAQWGSKISCKVKDGSFLYSNLDYASSGDMPLEFTLDKSQQLATAPDCK